VANPFHGPVPGPSHPAPALLGFCLIPPRRLRLPRAEHVFFPRKIAYDGRRILQPFRDLPCSSVWWAFPTNSQSPRFQFGEDMAVAWAARHPANKDGLDGQSSKFCSSILDDFLKMPFVHPLAHRNTPSAKFTRPTPGWPFPLAARKRLLVGTCSARWNLGAVLRPFFEGGRP